MLSNKIWYANSYRHKEDKYTFFDFLGADLKVNWPYLSINLKNALPPWIIILLGILSFKGYLESHRFVTDTPGAAISTGWRVYFKVNFGQSFSLQKCCHL